MNTVIFDVPIRKITVPDLNNQIGSFVMQQKKVLILHANVYGLNIAYEQEWFSSFLQSAEMVFCDGAGVRLAARLMGDSLPPRITYADWMWSLGEFVEQNEFTLFLLGAEPGVAAEAGASLKKRFPNLQIVGTQHGYFNKSADSVENQSVVDHINRTKPDILIVGFGMPLQERWLLENFDKLDVNVSLTGGAVFDYLSGNLIRAPKWMTDNGLEWLGRLFIEPRRLWQRYLIGNPLFFFRIFKEKISNKRRTNSLSR